VSEKVDALLSLPEIFPRRWPTIWMPFTPSLALIGLAFSAWARHDLPGGAEILLAGVALYFVSVYTCGYDFFTRVTRDGTTIRIRSPLPGLSRSFDLRHAQSYWYWTSRFTTRLHFMGSAGKTIGSLPLGVFATAPLEGWATTHLKKIKI
jgi:hypothetical protein